MRSCCIVLLSVLLGILGITIACDFSSGTGSESSCYQVGPSFTPDECAFACDAYLTCPEYLANPAFTIPREKDGCVDACSMGEPVSVKCSTCLFDCYYDGDLSDLDCADAESCVQDCLDNECITTDDDDGGGDEC